MSRSLVTLALAATILSPASWAAPEPEPDRAAIERGRYLVRIGGCNDCHTPGYPQSLGQTPESDWLTGNPVGFLGPWGTTYPSNLRLSVPTRSESQWLAYARSPMRPPMPSPSLQAMSDGDLIAIHRFIASLGPKGTPAPDYVPPGAAAIGPYIDFQPRGETGGAQARR
jgi:mono/diheme cytochrome c family protein